MRDRMQHFSNSLASSSLRRVTSLLNQLNPQKHEQRATISEQAFKTLHTGIVVDPDAATLERKRPIRLDLRKSTYERENRVYPYTTMLIIEHVFHVAKLLEAINIHLKYIEDSGDCYIMYRTRKGLVNYTTFNNKHWIRYLLMHATGNEIPENAGEGEFRLEIVSEKDGRTEYSVNVVYIQGGVKLTLAPIS